MTGAGLVYAATEWNTNAELIADCARLGYIKDTDVVLDPTYGKGKWWTHYRPPLLIAHDLHTLDGVDFRALPEDDNSVDVAAYDPPYVSVGGRATSGVKDMLNAYGMDSAPTTPAGVQDLVNGGLSECARVVRPGGLVLCKVQNYISSGKLWLGTYRTVEHALGLGLEVEDELIHIAGPRPQPRDYQKHARRNCSTMLVLKKPTRAR